MKKLKIIFSLIIILLIPSQMFGQGLFTGGFWQQQQNTLTNDPYWGSVSALLHFDGTNASTTFTEQKGKSVTLTSTPTISTAQSKFGGASGLFPGATANISLADSTDWQFGTGDFTMEGWIYATTLTLYNYPIYYGYILATGPTQQGFNIFVAPPGNVMSFQMCSGSSIYLISGSTAISLNTWYYLKVYRLNGTLYFYVNNILQGTLSANASINIATSSMMYFGGGPSSRGWQGYLDDWRITKGVARTGPTMPTSAFLNQ
jgi:hypothetical protein